MREERTSADGREMRAATSVQLIIVWRGSKFLLAAWHRRLTEVGIVLVRHGQSGFGSRLVVWSYEARDESKC